ncbi:A subunit of putative glutamyl-tRNA amidotransferase [Hortaea werneckii]|nr:A subunit of putative glutamyl-tRNA amidotransferase [Hortaea werneckii]
MPGTNMPIELDGVAESEASPVFERSVESPEKTPRTIRSIDALAEAYKNASPSKQPVSQTRKTTASTLSKCPSDMKLLCRQPSNRSEGDATTSSESCSFVLPLRAKQQPKGVTTSAEDDENNALAACAQNLEQDAASAVVQTNLTVANDAESITTDYEEFKTQLLLEDTMPTRPATPEYYSDSSPQSLSLMPQLYQCIRDESPSPTRGAGVNSWKFKIENWIGSPTGSQSHSQGHGTRAERQSISMSIDDSSMVVERDTVSGTMTPTTTAEAISPQSDRSGLMGSRTEFQLRCSERNMRYNALHNDDFDISTQSNVQKDSVQLPEYGNAFPYADDVSGDSDKENDPRAGAFHQMVEKSIHSNAEPTGLWGWTPSAKQALTGASDEEELHPGLGGSDRQGFAGLAEAKLQLHLSILTSLFPIYTEACDAFTISARRYNHHNAIVAEVPHHQSQDAGHASGFLAGKPIAIKDNIVTRDLLTTAASKALSDFTSPFDATVVRLLREHGALISSKTNLDEFGMGSHSQHSHFGPVTSLFSRSGQPLSAGGSSGGSAVAVATGQAWAALGTDTGGSVRLPAAYAGTVGFKPSYGMLSRWGVIQYANSLDTIGVLARTVEDARRVFRTALGREKHCASVCPQNTTSRSSPLPSAQPTAEPSPPSNQPPNTTASGTATAPPRAPTPPPRPRTSRSTRKPAAKPSVPKSNPSPITSSKRSESDGSYNGISTASLRVRIRCMMITTAVDVVDIILTPTAPTLPPTLEEVRRQSPVESYMNDVFTVPASLAGLPAVSVPVSLSAEERRGLGEGDVGSVGLQCIGQFGDDEGVLSAAEIVEGLGR